MGSDIPLSEFDSNATTPTRRSLQNDQITRLPSPGIITEDESHKSAVVRPQPREHGIMNDAADRDIEQEVIGPPDLTQEVDEKGVDTNLVEWDGPDDPENPQNMSRARKWIITMSLSTMTIWVTFASSVFSQATVVTSTEYHVSEEVMTLATSLPVFVSRSWSLLSTSLRIIVSGDRADSALHL